MQRQKKVTRRDALILAKDFQDELLETKAELNISKITISGIKEWVEGNLTPEQQTSLAHHTTQFIREQMQKGVENE